MKKWIVLATLVGILAGCGSSETKETSKSERDMALTSTTEVSTSKTVATSSEKKIELKDADFQIDGTNYKVKIFDSLEVVPEEDIPFNAINEQETELMMIYGMKRTDFDGLIAFGNSMKEQIDSTEDFQIENGTTKETEYHTSHYNGDLYSFISQSEGLNCEFRYYFLETERDYIVINFVARPSFFDRNAESITEILNSFVAA